MKTVFIALALSSAVLAGCSGEAHAISAAHRAKLERSGCTMVTEANGSCDVNKSRVENANSGSSMNRMRAVKLVGQDYDKKAKKPLPLLVSIGEDFTSAMINDVPVKITRKQPDFYEVKGNGYIISVAMDGMGVSSASWNHYKGRDFGSLNVVYQ